MIKKGVKYICKKDFSVIQNIDGNDEVYMFFKNLEYLSPKDNCLINRFEIIQIAPKDVDLFVENQVDHPSYYNTNNPKIYVETNNILKEVSIECIDVIRNMPAWKGNIIKYAWRAGLKEEAGKSMIDKEIEDLMKIKAYADDRIKQLELKKKIQ